MFTRSRIIFIPIAVALLSLHHFLIPDHAEGGEIDVIFRYDDYSAVSQTKLDKGVLDVFQKYQAKLTVGVIPFVCERDMHDASAQTEIALPQEKIDLLRGAQEAGVVEVALHGYSHQTVRAHGKHYSEFIGVPFEEQNLKLGLGKKFLEQHFSGEVSTFIPPWNSYDQNTVSAAQQNHFKILSGDFEGVASVGDRIQFIPATSDVLKARGAVHRARWNPSRVKQTVVILFHAYDFKESNPKAGYSLEELSELVSWLSSQKDVRFQFLREASQEAGAQNFDASKFLTYKKFHKIIPGLVLELLFPIGALSADPMTPQWMWTAMGVSCLAYGLIFFLGCRMIYKSCKLPRLP